MKNLIPALVLLILLGGCSPSAQKYLTSGKEKYANQDYKGAIIDLSNAIGKDSTNAEAWFTRGLAKRGWNMNCVGISFNGMAPQTAGTANKGTGASSPPFKVKSTGTQNGVPYEALLVNLPVSLSKPDRHGRSTMQSVYQFGEIADYTRAILINPDYGDALLYRGLAYYKYGKTDLACPDLRKAAALGFERASELVESQCK